MCHLMSTLVTSIWVSPCTPKSGFLKNYKFMHSKGFKTTVGSLCDSALVSVHNLHLDNSSNVQTPSRTF